jgi:transitional endoplasmic reticulum ATPase
MIDEGIYLEMNRPQKVCRIRFLTSDKQRMYLELKDGEIITATSTEPLPDTWKTGDIMLVDPADDRIDPAPQELWESNISSSLDTTPFVAVVKIINEDISVIDAGGAWKIIPKKGKCEYSVGNTVEADMQYGVLRVLSSKPLKLIEFDEIDDAVISEFRSEPSKDNQLTFDDFGGLSNVVARAKELVELPIKQRDALCRIGARPIKGVLFTGAPGTGKTLLARIIACNSQAAFYEINGPSILSKWYGQSEQLLRKIFADAEKHERAIIFMDEIDCLGGARTDSTHEASRRVLAQLLTLMDGFSSTQSILVVAATNRPQDLDPALLRPGRLDWEVNFPEPNCSDREAIIQASSRGIAIGEPLPYQHVAEITEGWSAAELASIWAEAALLAVADAGRDKIFSEDFLIGFERVSTRRALIRDE